MRNSKKRIWFFEIFRKWRESAHVRKDIDVLLSTKLSVDSSFDEQVNWMMDLVDWIRSTSLISLKVMNDPQKTKVLRVKYLLNLLQSQPEWKKNFQQNLEITLQDAEGFDLFMSFGLSSHGTFFADLSDRLAGIWMPTPHQPRNLAYILGFLFHSEDDVEWLSALDQQQFMGLQGLLLTEANSPKWTALRSDAKRAILAQSIQVVSLALDSEIKNLMESSDFKTTPFFHLLEISQVFDQEDHHIATFSTQFFDLIEESLTQLESLYQQIEKKGVSIALVYHLDLMKSHILRMRTLMTMLITQNISSHFVQDFFVQLVRENLRRKSVRALISDNVSLLAKKIVESSAKTGHHYITRNWMEYRWMFRSALGGGALTALTTLLKFLTAVLPLALFASGFLNSINYAVSFTLLQFLGWSLATKQPAMTAAALAEKMNELHTSRGQESLVDEVVCILRSQFAAISGNLIAVIPITFLFCAAYQYIFSHDFLTFSKAEQTIASFSILGPTPFYAILTGGLLFLSSLVAGWTENWVHFHQIPEVIRQNRRLNYVFGTKTVQKVARFTDHHFPALSGNIALGFFLGMTPALGSFFGLPLDVRHVTLSTGGLVVASMNFGWGVFSLWSFWLAVLGILSMGIFNLLVSFALSTLLAIRSQKISTPQRNLVFRKLARRLRRHPRTFFFPDKTVSLKITSQD